MLISRVDRRSANHFFKLTLGFFQHFVTTRCNPGDSRDHPHVRDKANPLGGTAIRVENAVASETHLKIARENNLGSIPVGSGCIAADKQNSRSASKCHSHVFDTALRDFVHQNNDL